VDDAINNAVRNSRVTHIINLGAGLDSTGIRLADIIGSIPYTEIDHPLTQKVKRERLHSAGIATPGNVHFQPIDFATQRLTDVMPAPSNGANIVSLTGVTYYLQMSAIMDTLASVAEGSSRGSQLIFDYLEPDGLTANAPPSVQMTRVVAERYGEPMMTAFDPKTIGQKLANAGWQIEEDLSPQDLGERYLERHPEYIPLPHFRVARAVRV
jgi:methyltransferase (TIGR00027 family)